MAMLGPKSQVSWVDGGISSECEIMLNHLKPNEDLVLNHHVDANAKPPKHDVHSTGQRLRGAWQMSMCPCCWSAQRMIPWPPAGYRWKRCVAMSRSSWHIPSTVDTSQFGCERKMVKHGDREHFQNCDWELTDSMVYVYIYIYLHRTSKITSQRGWICWFNGKSMTTAWSLSQIQELDRDEKWWTLGTVNTRKGDEKLIYGHQASILNAVEKGNMF